MARYRVTGGCGFIDSHLVDALVAAGHDMRILDDRSTGKRENVQDINDVVIGDVSSPGVVQDISDLLTWQGLDKGGYDDLLDGLL